MDFFSDDHSSPIEEVNFDFESFLAGNDRFDSSIRVKEEDEFASSSSYTSPEHLKDEFWSPDHSSSTSQDDFLDEKSCELTEAIASSSDTDTFTYPSHTSVDRPQNSWVKCFETLDADHIQITIKNRKNQWISEVPDRLFSSLRYEVVHSIRLAPQISTTDDDNLLPNFPFLVAKLAVIDSSSGEDVTQTSLECCLSKSSDGLTFTGSHKLHVREISFHRGGTLFHLRSSYFAPSDLATPICVCLSSDFATYARKPSQTPHAPSPPSHSHSHSSNRIITSSLTNEVTVIGRKRRVDSQGPPMPAPRVRAATSASAIIPPSIPAQVIPQPPRSTPDLVSLLDTHLRGLSNSGERQSAISDILQRLTALEPAYCSQLMFQCVTSEMTAYTGAMLAKALGGAAPPVFPLVVKR